MVLDVYNSSPQNTVIGNSVLLQQDGQGLRHWIKVGREEEVGWLKVYWTFDSLNFVTLCNPVFPQHGVQCYRHWCNMGEGVGGVEWRYGSKLLYLHLNEHLALILRYVPSFYSTVYKATDIDEVVADLYMDSPENLSIVSDPGSLSETVALPNNQVNDRQKVRPERERERDWITHRGIHLPLP